jgi:DNA-binding MarR family transcriptional regulator
MKLLKTSAYIRLLNCLNGLDHINRIAGLDGKEGRLLNHLILAGVHEKQLLVGDLIALSELGSQATLHGRIKSLTAMGFIKLAEDKSDGRRKLVTPTAKTLKHYESLSACLEKALKSG